MSHILNASFKTSVLGIACIALTGCLSAILPEPAPAPKIYRLVQPELDVQKRTGAQVVRVDNPASPRIFNTRDVLVLTADGTLSSAGGAQWADTIPQLVQDVALSRLSQSEDYISVIPVAGARADLRLHIEIRDFAAVYDRGDLAPPLARTQIYVTISDASSRNFLASRAVRGEARAADNRVSEIVKAQSSATADAMDDIVNWMGTLTLENTPMGTTPLSGLGS